MNKGTKRVTELSKSKFDEEIKLMKYDVSIDKELFGVYSDIRLGLLRFHADVKASDDHFRKWCVRAGQRKNWMPPSNG